MPNTVSFHDIYVTGETLETVFLINNWISAVYFFDWNAVKLLISQEI